VTWEYQQFYDGVCATCNDPYGEYRKEYSVEPGLTVEGKCSVYDTSGLLIFSKWVSQPNQRLLTKWELGALNITLYNE